MSTLTRVTMPILAGCAFVVFASAPAFASAPGTFEGSTTEDFVFRGCEVPPGPTADLCGTVKTHGFGKGTVETVITGFAPPPSGCFADQHTTTLFLKRDADSLVLDIDGALCPTGGPNFTFSGTYTVAGGTGDFAGATGSGSVASTRQDGPIATGLSGALQLDD